MSEVAQSVASGVVIGALYGLVALGFTVMYRTTGVINFAQGDLAVLGGYIVVALANLGLPLGIAILTAGILVGIGTSAVERLVLQPLYPRGIAYPIIATVGLAVALESGIQLLAGSNPRFVPPLISTAPLSIGPVRVTQEQILVCILSIAICVLTLYLIEETKLGRGLRVVAVDRYVARLVGIPDRLYFGIAFFIGGFLAAISGGMFGDVTNLSPSLGLTIGLSGFTAAVIGGLGNSLGALLGGIILGVVENLAVIYISPNYKDAVAMLVLIGFLLVRPMGLFGEAVAAGRRV